MNRGWVHASAVVIGEAGIVLFGPSGAGKSTVSRMLLEKACRHGRFGRLVGDDKVSLEGRYGRLCVHAHPEIAGRIEMRGLSILTVPFEQRAIVRLAIRFEGEVLRLPDVNETMTIAGIAVPLLRIQQRDPRAADLAFAKLAELAAI